MHAARLVSPLRRLASGPASGRQSSGGLSTTILGLRRGLLRAGSYPQRRPGRGGRRRAADPGVRRRARRAAGDHRGGCFEPATPIKIKERRRPNWSLAMVLALAVIAGYGIYRVVDSGTPHSPTDPRPARDGYRQPPTHPAAAASTPAPPPRRAPVNPNVVISLTAIQDCWVEFTRPRRPVPSQAYVVGGSSKTWTFARAVNMDIGNPGRRSRSPSTARTRPARCRGPPVTLTLGPAAGHRASPGPARPACEKARRQWHGRARLP